MNTKPLRTAILVVAALVACKTPSPVPVGTPDTSAQDTGEISAGDDGGAQEVGPIVDVDIDGSGVDVTDSADSDAIVGDVPDAGADGLAPDATPTDFCGELALPKPGEPCPSEGDVNCTNWGASSVKKSAPYNHGYCLRPNKVVCTKGGNGLSWVVQECEQPPDECKDPGYFSTCQVNSRGAKCCPNWYVAPAPAGLTENTQIGQLCSEQELDLANSWCGGSGASIRKCSFSDQAVSETPAPFDAGLEKLLSKCQAWCKDCVYSFGVKQYCPTFTALNCGFANEPYELVTQAHTFCLTDKIPGKPGPQCATSCADVMLTDWYKQNYGPK